MRILPLTPEYFTPLLTLATQVHGDNYLDLASLKTIYDMGIDNDINAHFICLKDNTLIGYRLTYAANKWPLDKWCSPELWSSPKEKICYFKSSAVHTNHRQKGIAKQLLNHSIQACKAQGALAGLAHIWLQSPNNAAYKYFSRAGGKLIKKHPNRWLEDSLTSGYVCPLCKGDCYCGAAEMLLTFS